MTCTVPLPGVADALTSVGAFKLPTLALAVVEPDAVQNATATVTPMATRIGARMRNRRARITSSPSRGR